MDEGDYSLPSPTDTPYRTPSSSQSRQSDRGENVSPSSSPPPLPPSDWSRKRSSQDSDRSNVALDDTISPLDPRRFTPTLHANLVSEILNLRRELEGRTKDIDRLEDRLHFSQNENERLNDSLATTTKDSRNLRRQMQLLEGGTLSAIDEISKEREEAVNDVNDLRRRLDQSQKRAKNHEETTERLQALWDKDRDRWSTERRALETKANVVEGRLKVVLSEIANYQHHNPSGPNEHPSYHRGSFGDSPSKRSMSALSNRRQSVTSNASDHLGGRISALGHVAALSSNLADELALDEEDEDHDGTGDERHSLDALPEELERPMSSLSSKAHKVLGLVTAIDGAEKMRSASRMSMRDAFHEHEDFRFASPPASPTRISFAISPILHTEIEPQEPEPVPVIEKSPQPIQSVVAPISSTGSVSPHRAPWKRGAAKPAMAMTSSACQTTELLPSPPMTPDPRRSVVSTIHEDVFEGAEMSSAATQTDGYEDHGLAVWSEGLIADYRKHPIPTIAIIPPASRPATPETAVVLPPRTKNAACQVNFEPVTGYASSSTQTEEAIPPRRGVDLPTLITSEIQPNRPGSYTKGVLPNSSRRRFYQGMPTPPMDEPAKGLPGTQRTSLSSENSLQKPEMFQGVTAPARSSSLYSGFEEDEDRFGRVNDIDFEDDDFFSRPTAKYTLKFGKLVSQEMPLEDVDELAAVDAGENVALEHLRQSEDSMGSEFRQNMSGRVSPKRRGAPHLYKQLRRVPSPKRYNIRKAALISSGAAAHSAHSSVRSSSDMIRASIDSNPPPFPVPIRFSSARIGKSFSEGGRSSPASSRASPTRREKHRHRKPTLRKTRSGPAVSPNPDSQLRQRSRSPPTADLRISIVPDMPTFRMPSDTASVTSNPYVPIQSTEASAPRPSVATGPRRKTSHLKNNSDGVSLHSTSVVDAIAQTMVGEWMFKYVRRRKSFGVTESKGPDYDPTKTADEISANVTSTGVRHKRWVWLAPYERSVMWSSKQPTTNSALLGKSGRKLTIQSVLDVKDDNPMPKGALSGPNFNRSILILTPQRALKFTASSQNRHYVWLTALSFLSHSPLSLGDVAMLPPPTAEEPRTSSQHSFAGSLRRRPIRDSIRVAKGSSRPGLRSFTTDGSLPVQIQEGMDRDEQFIAEKAAFYDPLTDAALPPTIPRFTAHTRKRSNTAPRPPPSSYRTIAGRDAIPAMPVTSNYPQSVATSASGNGRYTPSLGVRSFGSRNSSRRNSEASAASRPSALHQGQETWAPNVSVNGGMSSTGTRSGTLASNTGSANGTMRMDAFIETKTPPLPQQNFQQSQPQAQSQRSTGFAAGLRRIGRKVKDPSASYWGDEGRGSSPMRVDMEQMMLSEGPIMNGIYGSTRGMVMRSPLEVEVGGGGDPFRGF